MALRVEAIGPGLRERWRNLIADREPAYRG